jgi:hypothetical protein
MSVAKKPRPYQSLPENATDQALLRQVKLETERLREKLQRSILDNPKLAKKSALIVSMWVEKKAKKKAA